MLFLFLVIQHGMRVTHMGLYRKLILNEKLINLEKATSSILSVLLLIFWLFVSILFE